MSADKKVLMCSVFAEAHYKSRHELILEFINKGYSVVLVAPEPKESIETYIDDKKINYYQWNLDRTGINPFNDLNSIKELKSIIDKEKPNIVYSFGGAKAAIYSTIAAAAKNIVGNYCMINGLGSIFRGKGLKNKLIKFIMCLLFKYSLKKSNGVLFQNEDDLNEFYKRGLVTKNKSKIVNGSGVNLKKFRYSPIEKNNVFLFVGRLLKDKGIYEFVEAAKTLRRKYPSTEFWVVGGFDTNPTAVRPEEVDSWVNNKVIKYFGRQNDVYPFYKKCSVFILPSYHEGTPRTSLEAMAVGRPVITTDAPGCKETVIEGRTGFKIPVRDVQALVNRIEYFINNPNEIKKMGENALSYVSEKYDVNYVNKEIMDFIAK